ncbi:DUF3592 domain-containing protein [Nocardiopsis halophila]|uniref:DUF3592 domain-containing protein n=1 Tax=Nocardiopsis halophila TaxID=141692 RepID=UPI00036DBF6B|nr:DUF3592 domain-containing protein [Nocardiopsis halophila]
MLTGPLGLALLLSISAVIAGANLVWVRRPRVRTERLLREGVQCDAEVTEVGELSPPTQTEPTFTLRYSSPGGEEHRRSFTEGFRGIVPEPGWTVRVAFDPRAPEKAEIIHNPYLHPLPGAPEPPPPNRALVLVHSYGPALYAALIAVLALPLAFVGPSPLMVLMSAPFFLIALYVIGRAWLSNRHVRPGLWHDPAEARATVTHCWVEHGSKGRKYHPFSVEFRLPDGRRFHRGVPTDSAHVRSTVGQVRPVVYVPSDPTIVYAGSARAVRRTVSLGRGLALGVSVLFCGLGTVPVLLILFLSVLES